MTCDLPASQSILPRSEQLTPVDLLLTGTELVRLLRRALADEEWLDAYLLAAGLNQMVEDRLRPDPLQLYRAANFLERHGSGGIRIAGALVRRSGMALSPAAVGLHRRSLLRLRTCLNVATLALAHMVLDPGRHAPTLPPDLDRSLCAAVYLEPDVLRVPACFRSFDQHPDDMRELARRYLDQGERPSRLCVVGVRTSGSYLAPLVGAALELGGIPSIDLLTYRPGRSWGRADVMTVRETAAAGGMFLIVDDPPVTGGAIADTARSLENFGVPARQIIVVAALSGDVPPPALDRWAGVYLPWSRWSVHRRLNRGAIADTLAGLLGSGHHVAASGPHRLAADNRARIRARFSVTISTATTTTRRQIVVEGAGLGFFGRHAVAVATSLEDHFPRVYGLSDGLLYRDWVPGSEVSGDVTELAESVADYVVARGRALRVPRDPTERLRGRGTSADAAACLLSRIFGRFAPVGQYLLLDRITRALLRADVPSVPDGQTRLRYWHRSSPGEALRKVDFHQNSFSNRDITCYDPVFDLAGASVEPPDGDFERLLRVGYAERTGVRIDPERWLLYRLILLWRLGRTGDMDRATAATRSANAMHDYLTAVFPPGDRASDDHSGPLCAIDLDGVLETGLLGYPCTTPAGAVSLRALTAHGFRPIPVTGRCLDDVIERCRSFDLDGAVAEYGAVVYEAHTHRWTDLRASEAVAALAWVRALLAEHDNVEVDGRYRFIVRARSRRGPVSDDVAATVVTATRGAVRAVHGEGQTDFVPREIDKGTGLQQLIQRIGGSVALAVGDSIEDLSVLERAALRRAPRNAGDAVRSAGITVTRHSYQAGLADACADLLGHRPGACRRCTPPHVPARTEVLCAVLGLREDGLRGFVPRVGRLAASVTRPSWASKGARLGLTPVA
ncbi:HAD hydrolase family protein [Rhodococcus chondri]|uniref:HAD hydrolase family protein n=1 Tax=Rhodococcus chondri TaxID=3065941 RepID=A0ABU7JNM9_9NOCA|nr:HAD hydrolase family protein [Rhodococcus sp. CC-R104]MEE2031635.1 HAD hydrolase family protein [Rhodococcus sp. CC-R104]